MRLSHSPAGMPVVFDDQSLIADTGVIPIIGLAQQAGLPAAVADRVHIPGDKGANPGGKVMALVAGMLTGADSFDDLDRLRAGGMKHVAADVYAPSTLRQFVNRFTFGHVRALQAACDQTLRRLAARVCLFPTRATTDPTDRMVFVDIDDSVVQVYSARKQGAGIGYTNVRGVNMLLAVASTTSAPPVIVANRLRKGNANSARGAKKMVEDALAHVKRLPGTRGKQLVLAADSAYYNTDVAWAGLKAGADISITIRMTPVVKKAIEAISDDAWKAIRYPNAVWDDHTREWISEAEVAETSYTAFATVPGKAITTRLVVRRIPEKNQTKLAKAGQDGLFKVWRYHGFVTTISPDILNTVQADTAHRRHAVIEQVHAELKAGPMNHMPAGRFNANAAWLALACMAHNLARTAAIMAGGRLTKARTQTLQSKLVAVPARIARHARKLILHLPARWPWQHEFTRLWQAIHDPPPVTLAA